MINKIEIGEHCFGPIIRINGKSIFTHEYSNEEDIKKCQETKLEILQELINNIDNISPFVFRNLAEMVANVKKMSHICTNGSQCDQCGNYNYLETYVNE